MADNSTVPPQERLPWVVPKNCPKWTERLADYVVNERSADLAAAGTHSQAVTDAKALTASLAERFWDDFRARGKDPKPREKKRRAEEALTPEQEEAVNRKRVAKLAVVRLHNKIKQHIAEQEYDKVEGLVEKMGRELQAALD